jgi:hypothetical protein
MESHQPPLPERTSLSQTAERRLERALVTSGVLLALMDLLSSRAARH